MTSHIIQIAILLLLSTSACKGQQKGQDMTHSHQNPLLCNPENGICEIPGAAADSEEILPTVTNKPVKIIYFTDPICSSCWGIEPQLRKLKLTYGDYFDIEYRMGGLLPDWSYNSGGISKPSDVASHWDEVSVYYEMPIDGDVWLEDPLHSSYPPSIAFKAAQMQDKDKALRFLRRIREMVFLEKKNITKWEHLQSAAREVGLDTFQFKDDYDNAAKEAFEEDLQLTRQMGVRGFPTLFFTDDSNNLVTVYGSKPYEAFENALLKLHPEAAKKTIPADFASLFRYYPTYTTKEYATLSNLSTEHAETLLNNLVESGQIYKLTTKNGVLWKK